MPAGRAAGGGGALDGVPHRITGTWLLPDSGGDGLPGSVAAMFKNEQKVSSSRSGDARAPPASSTHEVRHEWIREACGSRVGVRGRDGLVVDGARAVLLQRERVSRSG